MRGREVHLSEAPVLLLTPREGSAPLQDAPRHSAPRPRTDYTCPGPPTGLAAHAPGRVNRRRPSPRWSRCRDRPRAFPFLSLSLVKQVKTRKIVAKHSQNNTDGSLGGRHTRASLPCYGAAAAAVVPPRRWRHPAPRAASTPGRRRPARGPPPHSRAGPARGLRRARDAREGAERRRGSGGAPVRARGGDELQDALRAHPRAGEMW